MSGSKLKDRERGERLLQDIQTNEINKGSLRFAAKRFSVSPGTIHRERQLRSSEA